MSTTIRPLHDRLVVKRLEESQTTQGGIVLPDNAKEKPSKGEVIAIGEGKPLDNGTVRLLPVKVGDKVLFGKYAGNDIRLDGTDYLVLREDDVIAIIES